MLKKLDCNKQYGRVDWHGFSGQSFNFLLFPLLRIFCNCFPSRLMKSKTTREDCTCRKLSNILNVHTNLCYCIQSCTVWEVNMELKCLAHLTQDLTTGNLKFHLIKKH